MGMVQGTTGFGLIGLDLNGRMLDAESVMDFNALLQTS